MIAILLIIDLFLIEFSLIGINIKDPNIGISNNEFIKYKIIIIL